MFNRVWISYASAVLLIIFYFLLGLDGTWLGKLFEWLNLGGLISFVQAYDLIIYSILLTLFFSRWIINKFVLIALPFVLWLLFYFKVIPRLVI